MTREEVLTEYKVVDGTIATPGKFEAEPLYAPHFYERYMDGLYDEGDDGVVFLDVTDEDREQFPELENATEIMMTEDSQGFIYVTPKKPK